MQLTTFFNILKHPFMLWLKQRNNYKGSRKNIVKKKLVQLLKGLELYIIIYVYDKLKRHICIQSALSPSQIFSYFLRLPYRKTRKVFSQVIKRKHFFGLTKHQKNIQDYYDQYGKTIHFQVFFIYFSSLGFRSILIDINEILN